MNIEFDRMTNLKVNEKTVKLMKLNGSIIYPKADFKTLKLDLGSSFNILGICNNIVAGYTITGTNSIDCKTYNLDTGSQLTSFSTTYNPSRGAIYAFYRSVNFGNLNYSGFLFLKITTSLRRYQCDIYKSSGGTSLYSPSWTTSSTISTARITCGYSGTNTSAYDTFYAAFIEGTNRVVQYKGKKLYDDTIINTSYTFYPTAPASLGTVVDVKGIGDFIVATIYSNSSYSAGLLMISSGNVLTTSGITSTLIDPYWTIYSTFDGVYNDGSKIYIDGQGTAIDSNYKVISQGAIPNSGHTGFTTIYLYKPSDNSIYKLENGTYTKLGETIATSGNSMLDNTRKYRADLATGKIYKFSAI